MSAEAKALLEDAIGVNDRALVNEICERVYVLDFGRRIYEGTTQEALHAPIVRAAYLGDAEVEETVVAEPEVVR